MPINNLHLQVENSNTSQELASLLLLFHATRKQAKVTCLATCHCASCGSCHWALSFCWRAPCWSIKFQSRNHPVKTMQKIGHANVVWNKHLTQQKPCFQLLPCSLQKASTNIHKHLVHKVVEIKPGWKRFGVCCRACTCEDKNDIPHIFPSIFIFTQNSATLQKPVSRKRCFPQMYIQPSSTFTANFLQHASFQKTLKTTHHSSSVDDTCPKQIYSP